MAIPMRAFCAASLGFGIVTGLAGCSISTAPAPAQPVIVQAAPAEGRSVVVPAGSSVVVQPSRY